MAKTYFMKITIDEETTGQTYNDLLNALEKENFDYDLIDVYEE